MHSSTLRIDSHQHFWRYEAADFPWIGAGMQALERDWLPEDLLPLLQASRIQQCVAVQARMKPEETDFLLALAAQHPWITAVIGWVELRSGQVEPQLARWEGCQALKGMRHLLQDEANIPEILASSAFQRNVAVLQSRGLVYEVLINSTQFEGVAGFCAQLDDHSLVLDHLGKPAIRERSASAVTRWREALKPIAAMPHVMCKLSGLVTEAQWQGGVLDGYSKQDFYPYLDTALALFGPHRLMFGSDWPVCLLAQKHAGVCELINDWAQGLSPDEQAALWGGNAQRCYAIDSQADACKLTNHTTY
ncbi:MAG: amidohydrolase family protein [Pseudomonadota bacterium]